MDSGLLYIGSIKARFGGIIKKSLFSRNCNLQGHTAGNQDPGMLVDGLSGCSLISEWFGSSSLSLSALLKEEILEQGSQRLMEYM